MENGRYLITTADERTWKFDRPVIFLGEWCRVYDRKSLWQDMDAIVAEPYGLGKLQKDEDHAKAHDIEEKLFPVLCARLNQYHGIQYSERFWRILLGHWLRRYIDVIYNRIKTLQQCLEVHQVSGTTGFIGKNYSLVTINSSAAIRAYSDDRWNNELYLKILEALGVNDCSIELVADEISEGNSMRESAPVMVAKESVKKRAVTWLFQQLGRVPVLFDVENKAFIINSYLPVKQEIKLHLLTGQVPRFFVSEKLELKKKPNKQIRLSLSEKMPAGTGDSFFDIISNLLFQLIPVCYLEGFSELSDKVQQLPWPEKPKCIFTSNNFDMDEVFKLWTALNTESGIQYYCGQHGNNYGSYRYMFPSIEESTADKFITWGWKDGLSQHIPGFIFKTAGQKAKEYDRNGGLLLIQLHEPHRISTWDATFEFSEYFADQGRFVENLQAIPRENITLRLHSGYRCAHWCEESRWHDFDKNIKIDTGSTPIGRLIAQSRLVVHSYDSTGILETLSQNIPTLAFWQNGFDHLRESAKPYYQLLVDAGIVHLTPESVAQKVNEVWDDVDGWWGQRKVQEARQQFCARYARVSKNPVRELKKILLS